MIFTVGPSCSRYIGGSRPDANSNFDLATLGFPASAYSQLPILGYFGRYLLDGYIGLGNYFGNNVTNTFAVHPSFTKVSGSRTVKGGVDMRWIQYSTQNSADIFRLNSNKVFTQAVYNRADEVSGNYLARWLLGTPSSAPH